jgi:hypothetical protein
MAWSAGDPGVIAWMNAVDAQRAVAPLGRLNSTSVVADQTPITTVVDLTGMTVPVTAGTGRRLKITATGPASSSVIGDRVAFKIQEGATILATGYFHVTPNATSTATHMHLEAEVAGVSGAHTYKATLMRQSGTGNVTFNAVTYPGTFLVEDIGV